MAEWTIRPATAADYEKIRSIYERARQFMRDHGNPRQWKTTWPPEALIREDIATGRSFVCMCDGQVVGVFVYLQGEDIDPTYRRIENGAWLDNSEYGVIHRIASSGEVRGVGTYCLNWAYARCPHLRADTHGDNLVMQNLLKKNGFQKCGVIYVPQDSEPRYAFEKTERKPRT